MKCEAISFRFVLFVVFFCWACSPDLASNNSGGDGGSDTDSDGLANRENTYDECTDEEDNDDDGHIDCSDTDCLIYETCEHMIDGGNDSDMNECASVSVQAEGTSAPVDIIWMIDSSGSMRDQLPVFQNNMNNFTKAISGSGIDYHVITITEQRYIDVPPPLGTDSTRYLPIDWIIRSEELFQNFLDRHNQYRGFLRPRGVTHLIAVTDDEDQMGAEDFHSAMRTTLAKDFIFHAVASEVAFHDGHEGCSGPNLTASDIGVQYYELASMTGGHQFSICSVDWSEMFSTLTKAVAISATLPCFYDLPEPPTGMTFDSELVNVVFTDDGGSETTLARAMTESACESEMAWYYDNNDEPTRIELCLVACDIISKTVSGRVDIALGCETDVVLY